MWRVRAGTEVPRRGPQGLDLSGQSSGPEPHRPWGRCPHLQQSEEGANTGRNFGVLGIDGEERRRRRREAVERHLQGPAPHALRAREVRQQRDALTGQRRLERDREAAENAAVQRVGGVYLQRTTSHELRTKEHEHE